MGVGGEHLGREQLALVRGMSRLAAGLAPLLAGRRLRLGRLDDVGGGGLGRVGGILAGRGELLLQLLDDGLESDEFCLQGIDPACNRWQLGHSAVSVALMAIYYTNSAAGKPQR